MKLESREQHWALARSGLSVVSDDLHRGPGRLQLPITPVTDGWNPRTYSVKNADVPMAWDRWVDLWHLQPRMGLSSICIAPFKNCPTLNHQVLLHSPVRTGHATSQLQYLHQHPITYRTKSKCLSLEFQILNSVALASFQLYLTQWLLNSVFWLNCSTPKVS
jgi:hypothetical protein